MTTTAYNSTVSFLDSVSPEAFDALAAHPMQSYAWGEARKATGVAVLRLGEKDTEGNLRAVFQMTLHKIPKTSYKIGYVTRSAVPSAAVTAFLYNWAKKNKVVFIKWEPYVEEAIGRSAIAHLSHMCVSKHPLFTEWNQEVDLTKSEEALLASFRKNVRYSIRHAETSGVSIREMSTDEGFELFADLYFGTTKRKAYHGHTRSYHRKIWNAMRSAGIGRIFVSFYEGKPHAAFEVFFFNGRAYYPYSGSSDSHKHIPSTQLLMWEVMREAKKEGMQTLDLWGSLPETHDKKHPWAGFTYFKQGFGSRFVHMLKSYDLVVSPLLYKAYSAAYALRKKFWSGGAL